MRERLEPIRTTFRGVTAGVPLLWETPLKALGRLTLPRKAVRSPRGIGQSYGGLAFFALRARASFLHRDMAATDFGRQGVCSNVLLLLAALFS